MGRYKPRLAPTNTIRALALLAAVGCVVATGGCGSSGRRSGGSLRAQAGLAFSECMRSHGVTAFPDPSSGGAINIEDTGINPSAPAFEAAQATCTKLFAGGGPPAHASERQKQHMVAISECMRRHGVSGFPDPTTTPPGNPQDYSLAMGIGDSFLLVPKTIDINSRAFTKGAKACKLAGGH